MLKRTICAASGLLGPDRDQERRRREYEKEVERFFGGGCAFAFWKGRVALYAILKALGVGPGDDVVLSGYTCVMVAGPIVYCGARPVYADILPETYNADPAQVARRIGPHTRAVLVQHTYGLPAPIEGIKAIADRSGIPVIEDCCHTFGGRLNGRLLGTFGRAAFFSSQWNKPYSTGLGGVAVVHDAALARGVRELQARMPLPRAGTIRMLAAQLLVHEAAVCPATSAALARAFRWMSRNGLVVGSSGRGEFEVTMPEHYALQPSAVQCRLGRIEVGRSDANGKHRQWVTRRYFEALPALGYHLPDGFGSDVPAMLRLPLRVGNKAEAMDRAARHGVEIGSWFECPLHPIETDMAAFGYRSGDCPHAEQAAREVINLPTHPRVKEKDIRRTVAFVRDVCRPA